MASMKREYMDAINRNMEKISNHMDGDYATFIAYEVDDIMGLIETAMEKYSILLWTIDEIEEEYRPSDLYEECCNEYKYFSNSWDTLQDIEDILD